MSGRKLDKTYSLADGSGIYRLGFMSSLIKYLIISHLNVISQVIGVDCNIPVLESFKAKLTFISRTYPLKVNSLNSQVHDPH